MTDELVLNGLLVATLLLSLILVIFSSAALGRKMADLEVQIEKGVQGAPRIQSRVNLRVHMNRLLLGLCFFLIPVLLLADAPSIWRTWVNRALFLVMLASYTISSILDWFDERKQMRLLIAEENKMMARLMAAARAPGQEPRESLPEPPAPDPMESVDVASIQPEAVEMIADAVQEHHERERP
jgi:hypothetical protein